MAALDGETFIVIEGDLRIDFRDCQVVLELAGGEVSQPGSKNAEPSVANETIQADPPGGACRPGGNDYAVPAPCARFRDRRGVGGDDRPGLVEVAEL